MFPFQIAEATSSYSRIMKLRTSSLVERENREPEDVVRISSEAKKRQILEQTKSEVLQRIRETGQGGQTGL